MQREIVVDVEGAVADALSDALLAAGADSVSIEDADAGGQTESPLYGEPGTEPDRSAWRRNRLVALIGAGIDPAQLVAAAAAAVDRPPPPIVDVRTIGEVDWVRITQAQFPPTRITDRLWIVPTWHEPPDPTAINVRLDPGVAFGTGTHPTTRLCLRWLAQAELSKARVLDFGCGSGILAIAAARLGAREVTGTDIDAQALEAARANSALNAVAAHYTAAAQLGSAVYDVILANILANPLIVLAPMLAARLAPGGQIVLSGILDRQAQDVIDTYADPGIGLALRVWDREEGWSCLTGTRPV